MPSDGSGNIRVFVRWDDQTVFAGEEIKCTITFKNVAPKPGQTAQPLRQGGASDRNRQLHLGQASPNGLTPSGSFAAGASRGHRSSLSLSAPAAFSRRTNSTQWPQLPPHPPKSSDNHGHNHRRSVSIVSIGSTSTAPDDGQISITGRPKRPGRGHGRAASLQIAPRVGLGISGPHSASPRQHSHPLSSSSHADRFPRNAASSTQHNDAAAGGPPKPTRSPSNTIPDFKFPMVSSPLSESENSPAFPMNENLLSPGPETSATFQPPKKPYSNNDPANPAMRILSSTNVGGGTPRSSGEFYNMSNHSSETLASEYFAHQPLRGNRMPPHVRQSSNFAPQQAKMPESIMMGYAQVQGSFTIDGSLINLGPFEQVKRKAAVGGQGGGVIGVDTSKRDNGLLRGFGWGRISTSLGDLLGTGELSSIKDMRSIASSKSVPLLSTPQSILFVDLNLAPGESRSFEYSFQLPRGLPPSHKGKAMKASYSLVIGTQRAGGTKEQQVRSIEIPFRVLGSVNSFGEILGYDLMNPYIILRDQATIKPCDKANVPPARAKSKLRESSDASIGDLLTYVDDLLTRRTQNTHSGLLSPSAQPSSRRPSTYEEATSAKEAINLAVLRSTHAVEGGQSPNRFEIARNGQRVAVVTLSRGAYRLGEPVIMSVDFSVADVPCYAVHFALESAERIADPQLALRSDASVHRATRRVHSSASDAALYARRLVFTPTIPVTATPEFVTSGIALEWKIRVEFVVPGGPASDKNSQQQQQRQQQQGSREEDEAVVEGEEGDEEDEGPGDATVPLVGGSTGPAADSGNSNESHPLLEEISRDERGGLVLVAAENLACESFEVAVPLRVYGAFAAGLEKLERDAAVDEGLVV